MDALVVAIESSSYTITVSYTMIKNCRNEMRCVILNHFNNIWYNNIFPDELKILILLPLLKPGNDPSNPDERRPIAIICCLSKLIEKMNTKRLRWILESNKNINDALEIIIQKEQLIATFFDLKKAFDMVWRHLIVKLLKSYDIGGNLLSFVKNFLENRRFKVKIGETYSETNMQENGIPQGSVLSVILFLIAINVINKTIDFPVQ